MPYRIKIAAALALAALAAEGAVRFGAEWESPGAGIAFPRPANAEPDHMDLPRAEAYLVMDGQAGAPRLEDRYDIFDLWTARTLLARWRDKAGTGFSVLHLALRLPDASQDERLSRTAFDKRTEKCALNAKDLSSLDTAIAAMLPVELPAAARPRRAQRRNLLELREYPFPDGRRIAFAFRPRPPAGRPRNAPAPSWYAAILSLAPEEDASAAAEAMDSWLDEVRFIEPESAPRAAQDETELLHEDMRRSVAAYDEWHFVSSDDVAVVDDLDTQTGAAFVSSITNALPALRRAYAQAVPSPLDGSFHPASVRAFRDRTEYLAYVGEEGRWTGGLWNPSRREIVLYFTEKGAERLVDTVRHEAFHQYLAYAGAMITSAPWFNEGHAELFEHSRLAPSGEIEFLRDQDAALFVQGNADALAGSLPAIFAMDYTPREGETEGFYSGTQEERIAKYRLAWSVAYFLQIGAPEVRFRPFENLRADYMRALVRTKSGRAATEAVLTEDVMRDLVYEWRAFWKRQ